MKNYIIEEIALNEVPFSDYESEESNLQEKVNEIYKSNEEILRKYTASDMEKLVMAKLADNRKKENKLVISFNVQKVLCAAAVLCFCLAVPLAVFSKKASVKDIDVSSVRTKGEAAIFLYKKDGEKAVLLEDNSFVKEGDLVQITYTAQNAKYGAIFSLDGNGNITNHYPNDGKKAEMLKNNGNVVLDESIELDNAPEYEKFYFVTSNESFDLSRIKEIIVNNKNNLPKSIHVAQVTLLK